MVRFLLFLISLSLLLACGDETIEERVNRRLNEAISEAAGAEVNLDSLGEALKRTVEGIDTDSINISGLSDVEVINFRDLKKRFPASVAGLAIGKHVGETNKMLGIKFSQSEATYGSGDQRVEAKLIDSGGAGILLASMAGFTGFEVDKETEYGSERTLTVDGHPAYEKYSTRNGKTTSSLSVLINKRFVLSLEGMGVTAEQLTDAYKEFDLSDLPDQETK